MKEFADGHYDQCFQWTVERRFKTFKIGNLGRKVQNPDAHLQTLSSLLVLEALEEFANWLGGLDAPRFMDRANQVIHRFREKFPCMASAHHNMSETSRSFRIQVVFML